MQTLHSSQKLLKMDQRSKGKTQNYTALKNNTGENLDDLVFGDDSLDKTPKA